MTTATSRGTSLMAHLDRSWQTVAKRMSKMRDQEKLMDNGQDLLRKGFHLAHFIVPNRATAIQILTDAMNKLEIYRRQEKKRIYWRHKHLKKKITRIIREQSDMLQWLIYFEAERHEKQQEQMSVSAQEMVIRYVKCLMQISTPMSSFYVNIGLQRLLHNYSTAETRRIYEWMTNHFPANEEYRKVKAVLMARLQARFGSCLRTRQMERGELRFESIDNAEPFVELVERCLGFFTPWSTSHTCEALGVFDHNRLQDSKRLAETINRSSLDAIETQRSHAFIHPPCFQNLVKKIGIDPPHQRLSVPRFFLSANEGDDGQLPGPREPIPDLTDQERAAILRNLDKEAVQRRTTQPDHLRILVDGVLRLELDLLSRNSVHCELQEGVRFIEIWTAGNEKNTLLETHWIDYSEMNMPAAAEVPVDLGRGKQLWLRIIPGPQAVILMLEFIPAMRWAFWKKYLRPSVWQESAPKYALAIVTLLLGISVISTIAYYKESVNQQSLIESIRKELAQEQSYRTTLQQQLPNGPGQLTASFRLKPDNHITRGSQGQEITHITVPQNALVVRLEFSIAPSSQNRYRAKLMQFLERKTVIEEDNLEPRRVAPDDLTVTFIVPASFLLSDKYYVGTLDSLDEKGTVIKTRTFTFHVTKN
jgi:hypothetical protein